VERLACAFRRIYDTKDPERFISFVDAVVAAESKLGTLSARGYYSPPKLAGNYKGSGVGPSPAYSYSACVADVSVDEETGRITVNKIVVAHDCGRALNPVNAEGQIEGSAYMGMAEILMEEQVFRGGLHKKPSLLDYKLPTSKDTPELEAILVETIDSEGPYGAKEAGEGPLNPVIPALANAVYDAIGVRFDETPITAAKVLDALQKKKERVGPDGLGGGADPGRAMRRLSATSEQRERKRAGAR
jgi:CO/xanthine dehydrogenase Mo-binding subunit